MKKKAGKKKIRVKKHKAAVKPAETKKRTVVKKRKFNFAKMVASGNDFIVCDNRQHVFDNGPELSVSLCNRIEGIGADGLIFIERSKKADFRMRIFNPDGSEAEMCGNGLRCAVLFRGKTKVEIETLAGILHGEIKDDGIKVKMPVPKNLQINLNLDIDGRIYQVNYINTGVPHSVCFVENLEATNVRLLGRLIRYHKQFQPQGTNVNFVRVLDADALAVRTYERGVEAETLACGTGSVASALIYYHKFISKDGSYDVGIHTKSGEVLRVYFEYLNRTFENVFLEGRARFVYKGECYV